MATLSEIEQAVDVFRQNNRDDKLIILHCVSVYPCELSMADIGMIDVLKAAFGLPVGYSDHTEGALAACLAITQGATVIEKHFTTDKSLPGFDHKHALDPLELKKFVEDIKASKQALAVDRRQRNEGEAITKVRARRGLYAARDLPEGHTLTAEDILVVRPASELVPGQLSDLIGQSLKGPVYQYEAFGLHGSVSAGSSNWQAANSYWVGEMKEKGMVPK
jgi:sialic acid synthase SpsE